MNLDILIKALRFVIYLSTIVAIWWVLVKDIKEDKNRIQNSCDNCKWLTYSFGEDYSCRFHNKFHKRHGKECKHWKQVK